MGALHLRKGTLLMVLSVLATCGLLACSGGSTAPTQDSETTTDTPTDSSTPPTDTSDTATGVAPCEPVDLEVVSVDVDGPLTQDLMRQVSVTVGQPAAVAVACQASDDATDTYLVEAVEPATEHLLDLTGLRPAVTYSCGVVSTCPGDAPAEPFSFSTSALPDGYPDITVETHASLTSHSGYVLTNHVDLCEDRTKHRLVIYDIQGRLRWAWTPTGTNSPGVEARFLGDDRIFWGAGRLVGVPPGVVRLDHTEELSQVWTEAEDVMFHHDAVWVDDDSFLALYETEQEDQGETYTAFDLALFDPATGEVKWEWGSQDGIAQGVLDRKGSTVDPFHANAMRWQSLPEGDRVWISLCGTYSVIGVDVETRQIVAELGLWGDLSLVDPDGGHLDNTHHTRCTHGIQAKDDRILVYDNGRDLGASRVTEYRVDVENKQAVFWWSWSEPEWWEGTLGDADWIDDERVLIAESHNECTTDSQYEGDLTNVVEVDVASGEVVWRLVMGDPHDTNYRAQSLEGCGVFSATQACPEAQARLEELRPALGW